ncbi:MAG: DNA-binding transcriptional regulator BolA [Alphaproteobacteria bacterium UBA4588]|nr:MAG: DNA-binding transcriptional regulator BolA [Alphaproteobacteria bacterium UBA4588]
MSVADEISRRLRSAFQPTHLSVEDVSWQHAGHAAAPSGGESHFNVDIVSPVFAGKSRVMCHRLVTAELADLLAGPVHALQLSTKSV